MQRRIPKSVVSCIGWLLVIAICVLGVLVWNGVSTSLHAEHTLHAYYLTVDLVKKYVAEYNGDWPPSWNALAQIRLRRSYAGWHWPEDRYEIASRVRINFGLSSQQVAAMTPDTFSGIEQVPPNYRAFGGRTALLIEQVRNALNGLPNADENVIHPIQPTTP